MVNIKKFAILGILILILLSFSAYAKQAYLNDTTEYVINPISSKLFTLQNNLTIEDNINHTFEGKLDSTFADYDVQYVASNGTGFLLHIRFNGEAGSNTDIIQRWDCSGYSITNVCTGGCGGNEFNNWHEFSVVFDALASNAKVFIDGAQQGIAPLCTDFNEIGSINFTGVVSQSRVKNNLVIANDKEPVAPIPIPEFTTIGALLALFGAGAYALRRRK